MIRALFSAALALPMFRRMLGPVALFAASLLAAPALANDARLVELLYDPAKVVRIEGKTKVQATIAFAEDERIENVAIGDSTAWQVTPNKRANVLFVKPLSTTARTNMTVITDRHTYLFDLVASANAKPLYVLRFTYPEVILPETEQPALLETPNAVELAAANDPYAVVDPARLNFEWGREGDRALLPMRTYDDGNATFLSWQVGKPIPAILIKDSTGTEGPVNFSVRGETIVVDGVPSEIILRSGKDSAILTNNGPVRDSAETLQASFARSGVQSSGGDE